MTKLQIYTDGSCLGNPGAGGWGYAIISPAGELLTKLAGAENPTTNNRMELKAMIEALRFVADKNPQAEIELISDSRLLINTLTKNWKKNANQDLWLELDQQLSKLARRPHFAWTKAHVGHKWNELVDDLARGAAIKGKSGYKSRAVPPKTFESPPVQQSFQPAFELNTDQNELRTLLSETKFTCGKCGTTTAGILSRKTPNGPIRVDCSNCKAYVKFARQER